MAVGSIMGKMEFVGSIVSRVGFIVSEIKVGFLMVLVLVKLFLRR